MSKILVITEKPSVARDIAKVLKCTKKGEGYIFSEDYIVSWAIGHLVTLYNPEDYDINLKKWKYDSLPIIPEKIKLKPIKQTEKQLKVLKQLMNDKDISEIICATDSGREGELIFRYIYEITNCNKKFKRLWISSMTDIAIKEGFANLKNSVDYDNLFLSAKCRSEADWLVGINASRAYTLKYNSLLSIGRVQTPTLAIIVERQKEIDNFVSKDYFEIKGVFEKYNGKWFNKEDNESKIIDKIKAEEIVNKCMNQSGKIINIENEEKKQLAPLLYDLTELQRDCNKKFGFSAKKTLEVAQDLYEKRKLITYPRTDSRYLSSDMILKINNVLKKINQVQKYNIFVKYILELEKLPLTKRIIDDSKITDHHAIIPTETNININSLSIDEQKVFDIIVKRFLAVFYPPYVFNITKITTEVLNELFMTKGNTVIDIGYMEIYKKDEINLIKKKEEDIEDELPEVKVNEIYKVIDMILEEKKTKPPKAYTEAMLLSSMENAGRFVDDETIKEHLKNSGIGTPATRAAIIERLIEVGYVARKGKILIAQEKGVKLIEVTPKELKSPETTGKWEKGLNSIATGKMDIDKFMNSIRKYVNFLIEDAKKIKTDIVFPEEKNKNKFSNVKNLGKCPSCQDGQIIENSKGYFCSRWKSNCKFTIWKNCLQQYNITIDNSLIKNILKNKEIKEIEYILQQTSERMKGDLVFKDEKLGLLEIKNSIKI